MEKEGAQYTYIDRQKQIKKWIIMGVILLILFVATIWIIFGPLWTLWGEEEGDLEDVTQEQQQEAFDFCGGVENDIHRLDSDGNGLACESLP